MHSTNLTTKLSSHYTKITGRFVFYLLLSATSLLLLSQCASPVPSHDDFEKFSQQYETIIEPDLRKLSRMLLEEEITEEEYHYQVAQLRNNSTKKINDLIYQNHELKQSTWASQGLPVSGRSRQNHLPSHHGSYRAQSTSNHHSNHQFRSSGSSYGSGSFGNSSHSSLGNQGSLRGAGATRGIGGGAHSSMPANASDQFYQSGYGGYRGHGGSYQNYSHQPFSIGGVRSGASSSRGVVGRIY